MPDKKYLIDFPDAPDSSAVWEADKWERNKDAFMSEYKDSDVNVFELEDYNPEDVKEYDQIMISFDDNPEGSAVWDSAKWERNKEAFMAENPTAKIQRVRYNDYWGEQATANREQRAALLQPDVDRNERLAELGYYDDLSENQLEFNMDANLGFGLKPLSSAIETSVVTGQTKYLDPAVQEFFANDSAYTDRMAEIARLDAEYESNPAVIAQREWEAEWRAEQAKYAENLENQIRKDAKDAGHGNLERMQMRKAAPMLGMGHPLAVAQYNAMYADADLPDSAANNFAAALNMLELAKEARTVKDKKAWQALTDEAQRKFMAEILQPAGANYVKIGNILTRIEKEYGAVDEESLTPEKLDELLTKDEQALILSFMEYNAALADAQVDASTAYKGAQQFAKSVPFMLEMMMTGGLYNAAGKAATSKMTRSLMEWAAKKGAGKALRKFAAKSAIRLTYGATGTLARTVAAPSTYKAMAEGAASSMDDEGHMHKFKGAVVAGLDKYIENFSEITGDAFGIAGKSIAKSLGKIDFGKVGKFLADSNLAQKAGRFLVNTNDLLKEFGFHGFVGEIGEELIGSAIREVSFVQPGALKEMFEGDNFGAMLIGFAPMSLFGAGMSAVSMGAMSIEAANLGKKLRETLGYHYKPEQIDHMMNLVSKAKNGDQVMQAITPLMDGLTKEEGQQLLQYGAFMAQNKAMLFAKKAQDDNLAQAKRAEFQQQYGNFWQTSQEGAESVQIAELIDGRTVFVTSAPNESGMVTIIDAKTGKQGFTNVSEYVEQQDKDGSTSPMTRTWSMDAFLESQIARDRMTAQEARMTREYNEQVQSLQSQITSGTKINLGTTGNPKWMVATGQTSKDGVFVVDSTGATHTIGWNQVADAMNQPIRVKTDQEIIDEEVAAVVARNAERRKRMNNATPAMTDAVNESAAQTAEVVAQESKHIPMNEDGTVNEAAFWEQDPEGYAAWNDEQNQDGGADTRQQIANSKAILAQMLTEAVAQQQTSNPVVRKQAKKNAEEIQAQIDKLTALEAKYEEQRIAPLRERAMKWKGLTNAPVHIIETEEELAKISAEAAEASGKGSRVRGMAKDGKAYIYLPGITEASEIDAVFMHEAVAHTGLKGMLGQQAFDQLCDQVWEMMSPEARQVFINYPGVNGNKRAAADEYIAHIAERMGAGVATAEEKTIWQKIVDFVRNVLRAMGVDINISESELADLLQMAYKDLAKNMAEAEKIAKQNAAATQARRNAPTAAKEKYDEYLTKGLTAEEIKAGAQNEFNAAQQAYNDLQAQTPKVEMRESVEEFIARKKAYNDKLVKAKALVDEKQTMMDEIARREEPAVEDENNPAFVDVTSTDAEGVKFSAKLTDSEIDNLVEAMKANAEVAEDLELTPENWEAQFGTDGMVPTPVGNVKMGENQYLKLLQRKRSQYFGMIRPTLVNPDIVLEELSPSENGERDTVLLFIKTFIKPDGSRYVHFESVTIQKDSMEISISSHEIQEEDLKKKMRNDNVAHLRDSLSASEWRLNGRLSDGSDLVPTPSDNLSDSKDSENLETPSDSARFSVITPEMDADYLAAVERGDMQTAQRMVLEAAKLAMPNTKVVDENGNPKVVYHGTGSEFYTFRETSDSNELGAGYYFSDSYEMAERYATDETLADNRFRAEALAFDIFTDEMGHSEEDYDDNEFIDDYNESYTQAVERLFGNGHVKSVFLNLENPRIMSRNSESFDPTYRHGYNHYNEGVMAKRFNDGIIDEMFEERHEGLTGTQYVAFKPSQIKSADPVTYDDAGNVIPLSERFNPEKSDIRFSVLDTSKAELKDKPIKLNGMHRFKVKSAFKGVKGADGSFPYLKAEITEVSDGYNGPAFTFDGTLQGFAVIFVPKGTISEGQKDNEFFIDPKAIESQLWDILKSAENYYEFKYAKGPYAHGGNWLNAEGNVLFSVSRGSLVGMHNISEEKLRKVIKQGGAANPSTAVIDIERQALDSFGEISLIMPSSLVDAETGRNAGTFTADAWTPTYPQIEKRFSVDELQRAYWRDITAIPEEMQHEVRMAFNSWLDNRTASGLAYMFLQERGEAPEMVRVAAKFPQEIKDKMSAILGEGRTGFYKLTDEEKQAVLDLYIQENFGGSREDFDSSIAETIQRIEDRLSTGKVPSFVEKRITADLQWMKEHGYNYDNLSDFVRDIASDIRHAGEVNAAATTNRALDYIKDNNLSAEYEQWKESLNDRYGIKEYLFDGYTPSGNPRWLPNTVENASKLMNKQGLAGATGMATSFNRFVATLAPKKKSLSDIRSSKDLLVEDEKLVDDFREKWSEVFFDLGIKCQPDAKGYEDYGLERLTEAAQKKNPGAYLKKEYGIELSQEDLQRLADMIKAIKTEFPARYFETKFQRPVYLNEFAAAVIPTTTSADIKQAIAEAGLPIFEYDSSADGARREATLKATDIEGVRFSFIGERGAAALDKADEATARLDNLAVARQMEEAGKDAKEIKIATGWERGADKLWRYEISDANFRLTDNWKQAKTLGEAIEHDELFAAYPDLRDIEVAFDDNGNANRGNFDPKANKITIVATNEHNLRHSLVHEIQHAIQGKEGFARGSSTFEMAKRSGKDAFMLSSQHMNEMRNALQIADSMDDKVTMEDLKDMRMNAEDEEVRRVVSDIYFLMAEGSTIQDVRRLYLQDLNKARRAFERELISADSPYNQYLRVMGEVEARNVSHRRFYDLERRRSTLASETEDIAREDQIFLEGAFADAESALRFSIANENQAIFVSNAARAVEGIKMEKATPAQWLAMIEKTGGLKAGEDKWMGLSDWLKASDKKTLTKAEVLEFVNEHAIKIEETHYDAYAEEKVADAYAEMGRILQDKFNAYRQEYYEQNEDDNLYGNPANDYAIERLREELGDEFPYAIEMTGAGDVYLTFPYEEDEDMRKWSEKLGVEYNPQAQIEDIRLRYTTDGLTNKREIALTVPTIEPWGENDMTHFGDAGDGRAVAWVRFGETTAEVSTEESKDAWREVQDFIGQMREKYGPHYEAWTPSEQKEYGDLLEKFSAFKRKAKVLVIDEIQSKRHQEGREQGYKVSREKANAEMDKFMKRMHDKYNFSSSTPFAEVFNEEEMRELARLNMQQHRATFGTTSVPDAPFEKNWHELAMKRMLRYAAEHGYDAIAWTKGEQQAERYGIAKVVKDIYVAPSDVERYVSIKTISGDAIEVPTEPNSDVIVSGQYKGQRLSDVVGKELADKILSVPEGSEERIAGDDLKVGGEGMKGFYDRMLPAFMNKYGKKWGVKVEDITLPNVEVAGRVMHSVPVTEEMKASVMEGQVMFSVVSSANNKAAGDRLPNYMFEGDIRFSLSKNTRQTISGWLDKREDLPGVVKSAVLDMLDQYNDTTLQLAMGKWFAQDTIRLPEDAEKCMQAVASAKKAKIDPLKFSSPMEIIDQYGVIAPKEKPINPDTVSTLKKAKELPGGIVIYDVEDSEESRQNLRRIINTHYGKNSSPWCLLQGDESGNLTEDSAKYWKKYSSYPKQVAFKDGRLVAFSANDSRKRVWWDRKDASHDGIVYTEKIQGDRLGRKQEVEIDVISGDKTVIDITKTEEKGGFSIFRSWASMDESDVIFYHKHDDVFSPDTEELVVYEKRDGLPHELTSVRSGRNLLSLKDGKINQCILDGVGVEFDGLDARVMGPDYKAEQFEEYTFRRGKLTSYTKYDSGTAIVVENRRELKEIEIPSWVKDAMDNSAARAKEIAERLLSEIDYLPDGGGKTRFSVKIDPAVREEMDTIKAKAMWDGTFMKAPNGAETNLTEEQWLMVRTNNFKNWFGDWENDPENASKVMDENGEPMVVYHGTKFGDFYEFKHGKETTNSIASIGYWFSPEERFGERFAAGDWRGTDEGRRTMHVFLNIRNPKVYESESYEQKDAALKSIEDTKTAAKEVFKKHRSMGGTMGLAFIGRVEEEYNTLFYGWKHGAENSDYFYNKLNAEDKAKVDSAVEDFIAAYNQFIEAIRNYEDNYRYGDSYEKFKTDIYKEAGMSAEDANAAGIGMMIPNVEDVKTKYVEKQRSEGFDGIVIKQTRYDKESAGGSNDQYVTFDSSQIKSATETTGLFSESGDIRFSAVTEAEEVETRFSVVTDPALLDQLNNEEYITLYRAMQVVDGGLYQPMAGKVAYEEGEEPVWGDPIPEQTWLQSDETPWNAVHARYDKATKTHKKGDLKYDKEGNPVWVFKLNKGNGKSLYANYNPYIHTSFSPLNDQFSEAQDRDNLVVVKVQVPKSELTSGYKAEKAHDAVGTMPWHSGPISGVLAQYEGKERVVMLTRYAKIDGIVPWTEVADEAMKLFEDTELLKHPLPTNVFMKGLREELESRGVQFIKTDNGGEILEGEHKGKTWASVYGKDGLGKKPKEPKKPKKANAVRFSAISTPTDNVIAEGMKFSIQDFARLAGNIFQDMPESFRKEAIEETFKRGWDMQSAIFQIPARLAEKENWDEADKDLAKVIREKVQDAMDESGVVMSRPLTTKEALWMLYRSTEANGDSMLDAAKRSIVAHNLGFDSRSMALKKKADDNIRYSVVRSGQIDAATDMYNYEANLWINRLKESWLDMNQSVIALQDALEKASGKPMASWENVVLALNQLSSKSYIEKKKYLRDFLMPLWDQIIEMTKVSGLSIEQIERYMMLKHGLERNKKFAMRDAKQFYREMYDKVADRMKNTSHAEQVVALSEANKRIADIDAQIATASGKKLKDLQEARERAVVEKEIAELVLRGDEQQNEADLQMYFNAIEAENNPKYAEFREKDYGGLTSMFIDQIADVKRSDYKTDEAYQAALLASVKPRFDKVAEMEAEAQKEVDDYESKAYMPALWKLVNAATKETLRHQHAAGMITTEQYDAVRNMFDYYVPLRGFADNTAEDMYSYYMNNSAGGFAKPIIAAKGRKTRAESPLGWIGTMAESAIQQDNKNEVKMKLYYALMNRPDTGVLSLSEMWYVYDHTDPSTGRKVFVPAYPPATDGVLTADQMRQHMDAWEQSMKAKQAIGEAYKREQGVNLGGSVIFQDKAQDAEHIIRVKVAGKDYAILVNGNPRAAQAINGLLNPDANVGPVRQWYGALRRGLSALMTSFSPLFWVANYQRDLLSSFMRTSLNEGWGQAFKYLGNRFHGWKAAKYIYRYDNGTMGDSYYENLYKEFAENGGITGYTSLTTNKEYEKLLADYAENVDKETLNWIKGVWDKFMGFGEAIEQVSRFAAYITARESGKSIEEAVAAAKEVSVNFNRKGSTSPISLDELEKLRDKNGKPLSMPKKAMAIVFSAMPSALKELYFFFNASIQALSSSAKLAKKSPGKAMAWVGMYMGLSVGLAFLNYLLAGDDDDNDYLDLPDYIRHSTALFKMGDNYYFKWSLPQEMRPFYATADILVSKIMGKTPHKTAWDTAGDIALAAAEWLPVNPFGTEDPILALVPDVAAPLAEIKANQNAFGGRIYNDMSYKSEDVAKEIPAYRKGTSKTGEIYVDMAEFLNDITGGDEVKKGIINLNPAIVEHLVEGYGGGIYDFGKMVIGIPGLIYDAIWDEGVEVRDIPFVNKVLLSTDETNMNSHVNEAFYHYQGIADNAKRVENEYRKSDDPSRADDYMTEDDWRIYMLFRQYEEDLKMADEKVLDAVDDTEKELALQEQNVIREMLLNDIARGVRPSTETIIKVAVESIRKESNDLLKPSREAERKLSEAKRRRNQQAADAAKKEFDSLRDLPEYKKGMSLKKDLDKIKRNLDKLQYMSPGTQRDSVLDKVQRDYDALLKKARVE